MDWWSAVTGFVGNLFGIGGDGDLPHETTVIVEPPNLTPMYLLFGGFGVMILAVLLIVAFRK